MFLVMFVAFALIVVPQTGAAIAAGTPSSPTTLHRITRAAFRQLRWIEGTWRGAGADLPGEFYERYRFVDDSTLVVDTFPDSTLARVKGTTRFELRNGRLGNAGAGARWGAAALDAISVTFVPLEHARNTFSWRRESRNAWIALLALPATGDQPARSRVFHMERYRKH